jgi:hypothetical protein
MLVIPRGRVCNLYVASGHASRWCRRGSGPVTPATVVWAGRGSPGDADGYCAGHCSGKVDDRRPIRAATMERPGNWSGIAGYPPVWCADRLSRHNPSESDVP